MTKPVKQSALLQCIQEVVGTARAATAPAHAVNGNTLRTLRVLLAEDNVVNQKLACRILEKLGAIVTIADNGEAAIAALTSATFDVVLMDCQMPVLDGYETTRRIRAGAAGMEASKLPIIALTAHALSGDRDRCLAAGMNDYLTKPIDPAALRNRLEELLGTDSSRVQPARENPDAGDSPAVLDEAVLRGHIGDDSRFLAELLGVFVVTIDEQVVALLAAATRGEIAAIVGHAHSIKGAAANVGAGALMRAATALECAALEGAVATHEIESVHTAWRDLRRHPKVEPFVKNGSRVA
jgi:CheY-like chemotaxis protein/HPt (histidine-containing phosphotransfer) domain-containing protein